MKWPANLRDNPGTKKFYREYRAIGHPCGVDPLSENMFCGEYGYLQMQFPEPAIWFIGHHPLRHRLPDRKDAEEQFGAIDINR